MIKLLGCFVEFERWIVRKEEVFHPKLLLCFHYTVDSRKLELSGDQKNSSSYREFEFSRNGFKTVKIAGLQSNLSIADMLYNEHLVIADTFFKEPAESPSDSHRKTSL